MVCSGYTTVTNNDCILNTFSYNIIFWLNQLILFFFLVKKTSTKHNYVFDRIFNNAVA